MPLSELIEEKLNYYAQAIITGNTKRDEHAMGELSFYLALRRIINQTANPQDIGLFDAINDTLQAKGLISSKQTFYK